MIQITSLACSTKPGVGTVRAAVTGKSAQSPLRSLQASRRFLAEWIEMALSSEGTPTGDQTLDLIGDAALDALDEVLRENLHSRTPSSAR